MHPSNPSPLDLQTTAKQIMLEYGFEPEFPAAVSAQLDQLKQNPPAVAANSEVRDLRDLLWSSIDNDTSRDLDQIEVVAPASNGDVKVMIGIADVDAFAAKQSPIDQHAACETTTVYTGVRNFPMLPEDLSTGITSLLENQDRLALVYEFVVDSSGGVKSPDLYRAVVRNKAQLQYNSVGGWLEDTAAAPSKVGASSELQQQLKLQDEVSQRLRKQRQQNGALNLDTDEVHPLIVNDQVVGVVKQQKNRATDLIEDFMVAANGVVARFLENVSSLRRIVRTPKRWDRIVQLAATKGEKLPAQPDSKALNDFLLRRKAADP
ncbi:MAG TPA: ribonuclease catalytic domain-containing protein, partial [Candidatus Binatia bacterium]|nr:ribonuclease catalytic domain-containing protein [Candidatus Binatia bacterium]